ncbi:hypothetical protein PR202_gb17110 [Eleusine coracana subsp. coracana]|uniref:Xylanase inhibitor C-terminal domain-containing protein n=1 Tax=Eleusine coracana subsp. coracana TaxID=191504 RepID=A0AAV5F3N3_ELECO|nr:hypothetical protein PR202_gb17110 [Eleusine coracana subsp. coracana]
MLFFYTSRLMSYVRRATFAVNGYANGASLPLVHRHGPCATVQTNAKPSRAQRRGRTARSEGRSVSVATFLGSSVDSLQYVLQTVLIDTGRRTCPGCSANPTTPRRATPEGPHIRPEQVLHHLRLRPYPVKEDFNGNGCTNSSLYFFKIIYGNSANSTGVYCVQHGDDDPGAGAPSSTASHRSKAVPSSSPSAGQATRGISVQRRRARARHRAPGTVVTNLRPTVYAALRSAFREAMKAYPPAPPVGHLDKCYNFTGYDNVIALFPLYLFWHKCANHSSRTNVRSPDL